MVKDNEEIKRKKLLRNLAIALLSSFSVVAVALIFSKSGNLFKQLADFPPTEIVLECSLFFVIFLIDSVRTLVLSFFLEEKVSWKTAFSNSVLGYFFTYITPFSAGGQPYQIWHLSKWGMNAENASAIILTRWSNMLIFLSISSLILAKKYLSYIRVGIPFMSRILWLVILASVTFSLGMVFFFLVPKIGKKFLSLLQNSRFVDWIFKLLKKDANSSLEMFSEKMDNFYVSMRLIWKKKPWLVIFDESMGILDLLVLYYILYRAITVSSQSMSATFNLSFWNLSAIFILLSFVIYYVPTPGSSGGVEGGFYAVLSLYGNSAAVMTGVLMWRLATYYVPILFGFIVMIFEIKSEPKSASS